MSTIEAVSAKLVRREFRISPANLIDPYDLQIKKTHPSYK